MTWFLVAFGALVGFLLLSLAWRQASKSRSLPCPTLLAWAVDGPIPNWWAGTDKTLARMELAPGMRVLEIGPGPGRLLIPAARLVEPGGQVVGLELQQGMLDRLRARAAKAGVTNLTTIHGDVNQTPLEPASFDLVYLCTVLGEIPDRAAAMARAFATLKPGGRLAITEVAGDPHYQFRGVVNKLASEAGFEPLDVRGHFFLYTALFRKPLK